MKKKMIYILCILAVTLLLIALMKRGREFSSGGLYSCQFSEKGIVESIDGDNLVVCLEQSSEKHTDFEDMDTLQLDCTNCSPFLVDIKAGDRVEFRYFLYDVEKQPLKVQQIYRSE